MDNTFYLPDLEPTSTSCPYMATQGWTSQATNQKSAVIWASEIDGNKLQQRTTQTYTKQSTICCGNAQTHQQDTTWTWYEGYIASLCSNSCTLAAKSVPTVKFKKKTEKE